ncbi:MAG: CHC2 zinc finger domain-containing protein [bacterium]
MIPEQTIAEILERVDLVKLIGRQVKLRKSGANFMGLCPFHNEKSPSFSVSPVRRTYHCFGCGVHGDAVRFLMEQQGRSFPEAVRELAAEVGVMIPEERPEPPGRRAERERQRTEAERLYAAQDAVTRYFTDTLFSPRASPPSATSPAAASRRRRPPPSGSATPTATPPGSSASSTRRSWIWRIW